VIAKSIAKWTHLKFNEEMFIDYVARTHSSNIQSVRGKRSSGGGRPKDEKSERQTMPWLTMGISRRKYYMMKSKA